MAIQINFSLVKLVMLTALIYLLSSCGRTEYQGYVFDKKTQLPLKDVLVSYHRHQARSDEKGHFIVGRNGELSEPIVFYKKGYKLDSAETIRIHAGETIEKLFTNGRDTIFLSPIEDTTPLLNKAGK